MGDRYKIERIYFDRPGHRRRINYGLTLEQAQEHCSDKETSSLHCTTSRARAITRRNGQWMDTYEKE